MSDRGQGEIKAKAKSDTESKRAMNIVSWCETGWDRI